VSSSTRTKIGSSLLPESGGGTRGWLIRGLTVMAGLLALQGCVTVQATAHQWAVAIGALKPASPPRIPGPEQSTDIPVPLSRRQPPPPRPK